MAKVRVIFSIALILLLLALIGCGGGTNALHPNTGGLTGGNAAPDGDIAESGLFPVRMNPQAVARTGGWPAQHQASAIAAQAGLARPSELSQLLPQTKRAVYLDADLIKAGADFDVVLPANRVSTVVAPSVIFSPIWGSQAQPQLSDAAYCIYRFSLAGFDASGQPQTLALAWYPGSEPAAYTDLWVGLASRANDRWEWYAGPADGVLTLASFTPYIAGNGDTLIAIVMLGSSDCALQSLKVGEPELRATGGMPGALGQDNSPPPAGGGSLPASVDLSPWCSPIGDQGQIGSCTCFATARGAFDYELGQVYAADGWDFGNPLNLASTKYLYLQTGADCGPYSGRSTGGVIDYLNTDGDSSEHNCPYMNVCSRDWGQDALDDAALLNADGATSIDPTGSPGVIKLKDALANQRKVTVFQTGLDWSFFSLGPDDVWNYSGGVVGYHAMALVGYDDAKQAFKVRNSWGSGWAGGGYCWIGYQTFIDGNPDLWLWAWTLDVDYDAAVAQRFCGQQQELAPPTNVRATDGFYADRIQVQWYKSTGATGYEVYRDLQTNLVATLGDVAIYNDYGIGDYLGHTYWVKATAPGLESALSSPDTGYLAQSPVVQNVTPQSGAPGEVVTFNAQVSGSTPMTYAWDFGGGAIPNTSSNISPQVTLGSTGSYSASLTVTNDYGSDVYPFTLTVQNLSLPIADLTANPLSGNAPLAVNFDASASNDPDDGGAPGAGIVKYEWDYTDDGTYDFDSGTDATVSHNYAATGTSICRVRVTDNDSDTATDTVTVTVIDGATYTASGYVKTAGGTGISGVTMGFTGGLASVTTNSSGYWSRGGIPNGTYTVTPSKASYSFNPTNQAFTIASGNATVSDFTGTPGAFTASGYVRTSGGTGISGVTMSFTGGLSAVATNSSGYWSRDGILNGTYTVTPSKNGYTFNPTSRSFTISGSSLSIADFTGAGGGAITILSVTTDKTTHLSSGTETVANLYVTTDPSPADTYSWSGQGVFSDTTIAYPTWKPNASTKLGRVTLTVVVTLGAASDSATIDMYVTAQGIKTSYLGADGTTRSVGDPAGSGTVPDYDMSTMEYLQPISDGGNISAATGSFYDKIDGHPVLYERWELWSGPDRADFPTLDDRAEAYLPYGFLFIANSSDTGSGYQLNDIKLWFMGNAIDYCHAYHGDVDGLSWDKLGWDHYIPFCVLIDRDKKVRMVDHHATGSGSPWQSTMEEISGVI